MFIFWKYFRTLRVQYLLLQSVQCRFELNVLLCCCSLFNWSTSSIVRVFRNLKSKCPCPIPRWSQIFFLALIDLWYVNDLQWTDHVSTWDKLCTWCRSHCKLAFMSFISSSSDNSIHLVVRWQPFWLCLWSVNSCSDYPDKSRWKLHSLSWSRRPTGTSSCLRNDLPKINERAKMCFYKELQGDIKCEGTLHSGEIIVVHGTLVDIDWLNIQSAVNLSVNCRMEILCPLLLSYNYQVKYI